VDLTDQLRRQLEDAVFDFIGQPPSPAVLRVLIGSEGLLGLPAGFNGFRSAQWAVDFTLRAPTPALFVALVRHSDPGQALVELHALVDALEGDPSRWSAPAAPGGLWIPTGWPFVDREPLRAALDGMAKGEGPSALAIEGPSGHGKRTMTEYVRQLAAESEGFAPVVVELRPEPDPGVLLSMVAELAMVCGGDADLDTTHVEPERQAVILARDIAQAAAAAPVPTWFVANVVAHQGLEDGVLAFIDELLRLIATSPAVAAKLRVVILCDQLSLLDLQHAPPLEARHTLGQVDGDHIRAWLEAAAPGKDPALYALAADTIVSSLDGATPAPALRLQFTALKCKVAQQRLAATG
jgi:hypothetical protein